MQAYSIGLHLLPGCRFARCQDSNLCQGDRQVRESWRQSRTHPLDQSGIIPLVSQDPFPCKAGGRFQLPIHADAPGLGSLCVGTQRNLMSKHIHWKVRFHADGNLKRSQHTNTWRFDFRLSAASANLINARVRHCLLTVCLMRTGGRFTAPEFTDAKAPFQFPTQPTTHAVASPQEEGGCGA